MSLRVPPAHTHGVLIRKHYFDALARERARVTPERVEIPEEGVRVRSRVHVHELGIEREQPRHPPHEEIHALARQPLRAEHTTPEGWTFGWNIGVVTVAMGGWNG